MNGKQTAEPVFSTPRGPRIFGLHVIVALLHIVAILLYLFHSRDVGPGGFWQSWSTQVSLLIGLSAVLYPLGLVFPAPSSRAALLVLQTIVYLISLYGEAAFPLPLFAWGTALILESQLFFPRTPGVVVSILLALFSIALPRAESVWNVGVTDREMVEFIGAVAYYGLVIYLSALYNRFRLLDSESRRSVEQLRESLVRLTSANVDFQDYAVSAEKKGVEEERHRITREIHDTMGYTLTSIMMMTKAAEELIGNDPEMLRNLLQEARGQCQEAMTETRRTLHAFWELKTPRPTFRNQVWKIVRTFEFTSGIQVRLEFRNLPEIYSEDIERILYRTLQEGLTNAFRHGRATEVTVLFWYDGRDISILIQDNGVGSSKFEEDIGLRGMKERFEPLGGMVKAGAGPGGGFEVRGWIPVERVGARAE
jgi:signal transduction histidine kinase